MTALRVVDADGESVAVLNVDRVEADEIVAAWNRSKAAPRWRRPFAVTDAAEPDGSSS